MSQYYLEYMTRQEQFPRAGFNRSKRLFVENTVANRLPPSATILDLACGPGWVSHNLVGRFKLIGVDAEVPAIRFCRSRYSAFYLVGDACVLPFPDGCFDAVIFTEAIEHFREPAAPVREIARVLAPGGLALITTPNCGSLFWVAIEHTWHRFFGGPCKPYLRDVHPSRFTRRSLAALVGQFLEVEMVTTVWLGLILTAIARKPVI